MRVLLVSGSLPPMKCGIGDYTALLAQALSQQAGLTVAVLTSETAQPIPPDRGFETLAIMQNWTFAEFGRLIAAIRQWKPDIVHIQFPTRGYGKRKLPWVFPLLLTLCRYHIVQTWHEYVMQSDRLSDWKNSLLYLPNVLTPGGLIVVRPNYKEHMPSIYRWFLTRKHFRFIPNASAIPVISLSADERRAATHKFTGNRRFIAYFGFALPAKGIESLFEILHPGGHHLVLICDLHVSDPYHSKLLEYTRSADWAGQVSVTGFLPPEQVGHLLAAADAVILPFRDGGGLWNTSLQAASQQGTFVLTTSREQHGYDELNNVYYAQPGDIAEMRRALMRYAGHRIDARATSSWELIATNHAQLYRELASH